MRRLVVDLDARINEIAAVNTSFVNFGRSAAVRYARLIQTAYADLRERPTRPGAVLFEQDVYLYHLRHSARRTAPEDRVKAPRHVVAYRFGPDYLQILALLHDRMDMPARLHSSGET